MAQSVMLKTRHILALTLVATVLCADRAVLAVAETPDPAIGFSGGKPSGLARQMAQRLTQSLRQAVTVQLHQTRLAGQVMLAPGKPELSRVVAVAQRPLSPFQFRLPPPRD